MNNLINYNSISRKLIVLIFTYFSILTFTCLSYDTNDRNLKKRTKLLENVSIVSKRGPSQDNQDLPKSIRKENFFFFNSIVYHSVNIWNSRNNFFASLYLFLVKLLEENQTVLIGGAVGIVIVVMFYIYARIKYRRVRIYACMHVYVKKIKYLLFIYWLICVGYIIREGIWLFSRWYWLWSIRH